MTNRKVSLVSLALLLVLGLTGCGGTLATSQSEPAREAIMVEEIKSVEGKQANDAGYAPDLPGVETRSERMIIWNAEIVLTVQDAEQARDAVLAAIRELGGYAVNTESWLQDDLLYARLTVRVPADRFEQAMSHLRDLAMKVEHESANSEDVTEEYVDLEARLRALEAKAAQLTALMGEAENTEAVLAVYEQLSVTQVEMEQVKGRKSYLEKLSAMATITVTLNPEQPELPVVEESWRPLTTARSAARSLVGALKGLGNAIIWFVVFLLPILLAVAVPIAAVALVIRLLRRRKRSKPASTQE